MSIILPVILKPNWAYFYALMVVLAGQGSTNPDVQPRRGDSSSLLQVIYFTFHLCISMFACLDQTDFIHFCSFTLNLCLKFTRINKSCSMSGFTGRPDDGPENTRRFDLEKLFISENIYSGVVQSWILRMNESYFGIGQKGQFGSFLSGCGSGS